MGTYASATRIDITAPREKTHGRLYAKLLMLQDETETDLLISMDCIALGGDICEFEDGFFDRLRTRLQASGIHNVICGVTHTHTTQPMVLPEEQVTELLLNALPKLRECLEPVTLGSVEVSDFQPFLINRTLELKDGTDWTIRQAHPCPPEDSYDTLTPVDHSFRIFRFDKEDGKPLAVLFHFGCHPLLGYADLAPTANYPGIAEKLIEDRTGAVAMLFQHTGGDATETAYKDFFRPKCCEPVGMALGESVLQYVDKIETRPFSLSSCSVRRAFPLRQDFQEEMERIRKEQLELCKTLENCPLNFKNFLPLYLKYMISPQYPLDHKYMYLQEEAYGCTQLRDQDVINRQNIEKYLENIKAMEKLSMYSANLEILRWHQERVAKLGTSMEADVTGIRLGDHILISAPVEPLEAVGRRLRDLDPRLILFSYANGYMHYGATPDKYERRGYEVHECDLAPQWLTVYLDAVKEILTTLNDPTKGAV